MTDWITKDKYLAETGLTDGQWRGYKQRRLVISGVHFSTEGRTTMINKKAMDDLWTTIGQQKASNYADPRTSTPTAEASVSGSATRGRLTRKSSPATSSMRVISPLRSVGGTK